MPEEAQQEEKQEQAPQASQEGQRQPEQTPQPESPQPKAAEFDGEFDAERARKLIENLRGDKTKLTTERDTAATKSAKFDELVKAMGFGEEESADPDKLQVALAEREIENWTLKVDYAVQKAARKADGDPDLLSAVLFHDGKVDDLDPTADDFAEQIDAIVVEAIEGNERLRASAPAPPPPPDLKQGVRSSSHDGQLTRADIKNMSPEKIVQARKEGRLDDLAAGRNKN
ncbi:MAG: hypothetical protein ACRDMV_25315 [Streptosporangiales bacterium]